MKTLLCTLVLATLGTAVAKADCVTITLDQATQSAAPGQTIAVFGDITNNSGDTLYFNNDTITLNGESFTITDDFLSNVPFDLAPGQSSGDIELFDVTVSDPLADPAGIYTGSYTLIGGADGGTFTAQDKLDSTSFSIDTAPAASTVPEPASIYLMLGGLTTLAPFARRFRR